MDNNIKKIWKLYTNGVILYNINSDISLYPIMVGKKAKYIWNKKKTKYKGLRTYIHNPNKSNSYKVFNLEITNKDHIYIQLYNLIKECSCLMMNFIKTISETIINDKQMCYKLNEFIENNKITILTDKNKQLTKHFFLLRIVLGPINNNLISDLDIYKDLLHIFSKDILSNHNNVQFVYEIHIKFNIYRPIEIIGKPDIHIRCLIFTHCQSYCMQKIYNYPLSPLGGDSFFYYITKTLKISGITQRNIHLFIKRQLQNQLQRNVYKLPTNIRNVRHNYFKQFNTLNIDLIDLTNPKIIHDNWGISNTFTSLYILVCVEIDSGICAARWMKSKKMQETLKAIEGILIEYCIMYGFIPGMHLKNLTADAGNEFNNLSKNLPLLRVTTNKLLSNSHVENINKQICRRIFNKYIIPSAGNNNTLIDKKLNILLQNAVDNINHSYNTGIVHRFGRNLILNNNQKPIFTPYTLIHEYLVHPRIRDLLINIRDNNDLKLLHEVRIASSFNKGKDEFKYIHRKIRHIQHLYENNDIQSWYANSINNLQEIHMKHLHQMIIKNPSTSNVHKLTPMLKPLPNLTIVRVLIDDTNGSTPILSNKKNKIENEKHKRLIRKNINDNNFYKGYRSHWSYVPYIILKSMKITEYKNIYLVWPFNDFAIYVYHFLLDKIEDENERNLNKNLLWWKQFIKWSKDKTNNKWYESLGPWKDLMQINQYQVNNIISLMSEQAKNWKFRDELQSVSIYTNQNCILNPLIDIKKKTNKNIFNPLHIQFHQWVPPLEHSNKKTQIISVPDFSIDWYDEKNIITHNLYN